MHWSTNSQNLGLVYALCHINNTSTVSPPPAACILNLYNIKTFVRLAACFEGSLKKCEGKMWKQNLKPQKQKQSIKKSNGVICYSSEPKSSTMP